MLAVAAARRRRRIRPALAVDHARQWWLLPTHAFHRHRAARWRRRLPALLAARWRRRLPTHPDLARRWQRLPALAVHRHVPYHAWWRRLPTLPVQRRQLPVPALSPIRRHLTDDAWWQLLPAISPVRRYLTDDPWRRLLPALSTVRRHRTDDAWRRLLPALSPVHRHLADNARWWVLRPADAFHRHHAAAHAVRPRHPVDALLTDGPHAVRPEHPALLHRALHLLDDASRRDMGPVRVLVPAGPDLRPERRGAVRARPHRAGGAGEHARRRRGRALPRGHGVAAQLHGQRHVSLHHAAGQGRVRRRAQLRGRRCGRCAGPALQDGQRGLRQALGVADAGRWHALVRYPALFECD